MCAADHAASREWHFRSGSFQPEANPSGASLAPRYIADHSMRMAAASGTIARARSLAVSKLSREKSGMRKVFGMLRRKFEISPYVWKMSKNAWKHAEIAKEDRGIISKRKENASPIWWSR